MRVLPVPNVNVEPGSLKVIRNSQNEGVLPPTISASRGTTMPVCGGVEEYNEQCLCVKYHSQWVLTSFYESTPSAQDPLGDTTSQGFTEDSGNARANIPNASKESNLRDTSRFSRVLLEHIPSTQGFWRVPSSNRLKATERPHRHTSLSYADHKLSVEYRRKRRLHIQNRSA